MKISNITVTLKLNEFRGRFIKDNSMGLYNNLFNMSNQCRTKIGAKKGLKS